MEPQGKLFFCLGLGQMDELKLVECHQEMLEMIAPIAAHTHGPALVHGF